MSEKAAAIIQMAIKITTALLMSNDEAGMDEMLCAMADFADRKMTELKAKDNKN